MKSRNEQISDLFRDEQATVQQRVTRKANVPAATIEDACAFAWTQLVAHTEVRLTPKHEVLGWLTQVAVREAWRHGRQAARAMSFEDFGVEDDSALGFLVAPENVERTVLGRDRLRALKALTDRKLPALTERQRQMLVLHATGHTYAEISEITGATLRTVDRQLRRAIERAREHDPERT